jgi:hypothetical protein
MAMVTCLVTSCRILSDYVNSQGLQGTRAQSAVQHVKFCSVASLDRTILSQWDWYVFRLYMCACACTGAPVCVCVCARARARTHVRACECVCVRACARALVCTWVVVLSKASLIGHGHAFSFLIPFSIMV